MDKGGEYNLITRLGEGRSAASDELAREIQQHREEDKNRSYLGKLIVTVTEPFHQSDKSLDKMQSMLLSSRMAAESGDYKGAAAVQSKMADAVNDDLKARRSADGWVNHTGSFAKSVGLFFPGKAGYTISALAGASDAAHPADSGWRQGADMLLGAGKGAALKLTFDKIGQAEMNLALKAGALSFTNRIAEVGLDSHTYFDKKTGAFDFTGGLKRTGIALTDTNQLASDLVTFGGGYLAMQKLGITAEFAKTNPLMTQALVGGSFGFSSGFFSDIQTQKKLGQDISLVSALGGGVLQAALDGTAATIGGVRMQQMHTEAKTAAETRKANQLDSGKALFPQEHVVGVYGLDSRPVARPRGGSAEQSMLASSSIARDLMPQSAAGIREFVASEDISGLLPALRARGLSDPALVKVREVLGTAGDKSQLGPEKTMLIGHAEPGMKLPVEKAAAADLLATCDPKLLEALGLRDVGSKHIFPDAGSSKVLLQVPGSNRLRFSLPDALAKSPHANEPTLELGNRKQNWVENPRDPIFPGLYPVSDLLRGLEKTDNFYNNHDVPAMIKAMENYPTRASKILGGGSDTVAIQLENGNVLRLTDKDFESPQGKYAWDDDWGTRWVHWQDKYVRIDSRILTPPKHTLIGETNVISYEQQKGVSPVSVDHTKLFDAMIERDGHYIFWDKDPSRLKTHGADQLAYVPLVRFKNGDLSGLPVYDPITGRMTNKAIALIDYDAVRIEGEQPYQRTGENEEWIGGRYLREQYLDE